MIKIHGFKYYDVWMDASRTRYIIINKMTGVKESFGTRLSQILFEAEALNETLEKFLEKEIKT